MTDPATSFKRKVVSLKTGDVHVYHVGNLASAVASSPSFRNIQMFTRGLHLMGRVSLRQRPVSNVIDSLDGQPVAQATEYSFKVIRPIAMIDFEVARKANLEDYRAA